MKILKCFKSWISIQAITLADVPDNPIVAQAFSILLSHDVCQSGKLICKTNLVISQAPSSLHDCATECVCALLQHLEDNNNQMELEMQIVAAVVSLEKSYHMTVAEESTDK
jgi:transportin-3